MTSKKNIYLFANWKMYLNLKESVKTATALARAAKKFSKNIKMVIFPSALSFGAVRHALKGVKISAGAQNAHWEDKGGFTGEVSVPMYKNAGAKYVLVGHSERRHLFHENNRDEWRKLKAVVEHGLTPVLCVGETLKEKEDGRSQEVVEVQLRAALHELKLSSNQELFIAYEPVWAIGTGNACDPTQAQAMHQLIKKMVGALLPKVKLVLLYGGSVRSKNVAQYLIKPDINGVLVGHASSELKSWLEIVKNSYV